MKSEKELIFSILKQMSSSIVNTFPRNCEVAIHDLENLNTSLVHLEGNITNRKLGAPISELTLNELKQKEEKAGDLINYTTRSSDGRDLKSTSCFIRDQQEKIIFVFGINFDTTDYVNAIHALESLSGHIGPNNKSNEIIAHNVDETIESLFNSAKKEIGKQAVSMNTDEKRKLVEMMEKNGAFLIKGAVDQTAVLMGVSKYTVYNYLQKVRATQAVAHH
ncbi:MAG: transcriptional regulator [Proteobacteria bacterium]|nr:transcriptional regulator [Pseudomonadota bacterium]